MSIILFLTCFGCGLLGILFHVLQGAVKQRKRSKTANIPFSLWEYMQDQILSVMLSMCAVLILIVCLDEFAQLKPEVWDYVKFTMIACGFMGSSLLMAAFGAAEKKYLQIIDKKTDIADNINQN